MTYYLNLKNVDPAVARDVEGYGVNVVAMHTEGNSTEMTVEVKMDFQPGALEHFGEVRPCERVTMFGVPHHVANAEIERMCCVKVVGDHLCGNRFDNTKDITVAVSYLSKLSRLGTYCKEWKSVAPFSRNNRMKQKPQNRLYTSVVLMLQVVLPPGTGLVEEDKRNILKEYLRRTRRSMVACSGAKSKKKGNGRAYTSVYTFYMWCAKDIAEGYLNLSAPLLDAVPFVTQAKNTVYLNTIQQSSKPGVYDNGEKFEVRLAEEAPRSPSASTVDSSDLQSVGPDTECGSDVGDSEASREKSRCYRYDPYSMGMVAYDH